MAMALGRQVRPQRGPGQAANAAAHGRAAAALDAPARAARRARATPT
ncbi:MAG: hypothetical protein MZW92_44545 [Comamonadaceae bacterium]|nr:hypothetical protein [Comamonadaceae bacterium]